MKINRATTTLHEVPAPSHTQESPEIAAARELRSAVESLIREITNSQVMPSDHMTTVQARDADLRKAELTIHGASGPLSASTVPTRLEAWRADMCREIEQPFGNRVISTPALESPHVRNLLVNDGREIVAEIDKYIARCQRDAAQKVEIERGQQAALDTAMAVPGLAGLIDSWFDLYESTVIDCRMGAGNGMLNRILEVTRYFLLRAKESGLGDGTALHLYDSRDVARRIAIWRQNHPQPVTGDAA